MSITGIIIIAVTAFYAIAFACRKFKEEWGVHKSTNKLHCEDDSRVRKYCLAHGIDKRAADICKKYNNIINTVRGKVKPTFLADMDCEVLAPLKQFMNDEELEAFNGKNEMKLLGMIDYYILFGSKYYHDFDDNLESIRRKIYIRNHL